MEKENKYLYEFGGLYQEEKLKDLIEIDSPYKIKCNEEICGWQKTPNTNFIFKGFHKNL